MLVPCYTVRPTAAEVGEQVQALADLPDFVDSPSDAPRAFSSFVAPALGRRILPGELAPTPSEMPAEPSEVPAAAEASGEESDEGEEKDDVPEDTDLVPPEPDPATANIDAAAAFVPVDPAIQALAEAAARANARRNEIAAWLGGVEQPPDLAAAASTALRGATEAAPLAPLSIVVAPGLPGVSVVRKESCDGQGSAVWRYAHAASLQGHSRPSGEGQQTMAGSVGPT
jgi:hypothetical protein